MIIDRYLDCINRQKNNDWSHNYSVNWCEQNSIVGFFRFHSAKSLKNEISILEKKSLMPLTYQIL